MVTFGALPEVVLAKLHASATIVASANRRRPVDAEPLTVWSGGPQDDYRAMSLPVAVVDGEQVVMTVAYNAFSQIVLEPVETVAQRLHPVLDRYFRLWSRHRSERRRAVEHEAALDLSGIATAIVDSSGQAIHLNARMRRLLDAGDGLRLDERDGALLATDVGSSVRLQVAIRHALAGGFDDQGVSRAGSTLLCRRPHSPQGLTVTVSAVQRPPMEPGSAVVVVHALAPDGDVSYLVRPLCALHGLSPTETTLVVHLVNGATLEAAAQGMRVKPDTARSYLKQIFLKTSTARQVDLVRLMLGSMVRLEAQTTALA
ncbi:MAG: helix-turn-helix transcriptional regulator [Janthinobacterium lividum]